MAHDLRGPPLGEVTVSPDYTNIGTNSVISEDGQLTQEPIANGK